MKNQNIVLSMLTGAFGCQTSSSVPEIISRLVANDDPRPDVTAHRVIGELRGDETISSAEVARVVAACMIALPDATDAIYNAFIMNRIGILSRGSAEGIMKTVSARSFIEGMALGWIQGAVWLHENEQCDEKLRNDAPKHLAECLKFTHGHSDMELSQEMSGRLANVSGKFVKAFDCSVIFSAFKEEGYTRRPDLFENPRLLTTAILSELVIKSVLSKQLNVAIDMLVDTSNKASTAQAA